MTVEEYFGDWSEVLDINMADVLLKKAVSYHKTLCPLPRNVFKAFKLCSFNNLKVVILGQDPYCNYTNGVPVATGIAFANSRDTKEENYSPSLEKLKESFIDYTIPHRLVNFDISLEKLEAQGVLLLNAALTCEKGKIGSHLLMWRPFIIKFLSILSFKVPDITYVLLGSTAQSFRPYIKASDEFIIESKHPSWYVRTKTRMPSDIWRKVNKNLKFHYNTKIEWFEEEK